DSAEAQLESALEPSTAQPAPTGAIAATPEQQLEKFWSHQSESRQTSKATGIGGARAIAEGTAKIEMEDLIVTMLGGEDARAALPNERATPRRMANKGGEDSGAAILGRCPLFARTGARASQGAANAKQGQESTWTDAAAGPKDPKAKTAAKKGREKLELDKQAKR
ncbi:unnamed protein product, partial [Prorocentrum cordatum]